VQSQITTQNGKCDGQHSLAHVWEPVSTSKSMGCVKGSAERQAQQVMDFLGEAAPRDAQGMLAGALSILGVIWFCAESGSKIAI